MTRCGTLDTLRENSTQYIDRALAPLIKARVPFSSTYGNHDNQANISHLAELERENKIAPLSYTRRAPKGVGGIGGEANYWVPVYADQKSAHLRHMTLSPFTHESMYSACAVFDPLVL